MLHTVGATTYAHSDAIPFDVYLPCSTLILTGTGAARQLRELFRRQSASASTRTNMLWQCRAEKPVERKGKPASQEAAEVLRCRGNAGAMQE